MWRQRPWSAKDWNSKRPGQRSQLKKPNYLKMFNKCSICLILLSCCGCVKWWDCCWISGRVVTAGASRPWRNTQVGDSLLCGGQCLSCPWSPSSSSFTSGGQSLTYMSAIIIIIIMLKPLSWRDTVAGQRHWQLTLSWEWLLNILTLRLFSDTLYFLPR